MFSPARRYISSSIIPGLLAFIAAEFKQTRPMLDLSLFRKPAFTGASVACDETGLAIALPAGYAAFVHPRSGLAARHGVTIVNAPGNPTSQSFTPEQLTTLKPLAKPDLDILGNTSLSKADYVVSQDGTTVLDLWSFTVADQSSAVTLAKKFDTDQGRFGFEPSDITTDDGQYTAQMSQQQNGSKNIVVYRLHYVVGNEVIRVEAFDPSGEKARADFVKLLQLQTELTPPGK